DAGHARGYARRPPGRARGRWLERDPARAPAGQHRREAAVPRLAPHPRQRQRLATAVPRERRADVQPRVPLHRLPRHRRGSQRHVMQIASAPVRAGAGENRLLAAFPPAELARLAPHLEPVAMTLGDILYEPGAQLKHAYFPTSAIVSLHYVAESGDSAEAAGVGNEGVVGVGLFL